MRGQSGAAARAGTRRCAKRESPRQPMAKRPSRRDCEGPAHSHLRREKRAWCISTDSQSDLALSGPRLDGRGGGCRTWTETTESHRPVAETPECLPENAEDEGRPGLTSGIPGFAAPLRPNRPRPASSPGSPGLPAMQGLAGAWCDGLHTQRFARAPMCSLQTPRAPVSQPPPRHVSHRAKEQSSRERETSCLRIPPQPLVPASPRCHCHCHPAAAALLCPSSSS